MTCNTVSLTNFPRYKQSLPMAQAIGFREAIQLADKFFSWTKRKFRSVNFVGGGRAEYGVIQLTESRA
jgi:hypothetical protein